MNCSWTPGLVSTIIPVHNRSALLREAVGSVLDQVYRPIEIILVDDGSTDDTGKVCRILAEQHSAIIRMLKQENAGPGAARESGRQVASGEFIQYLDSDDLLHPLKFEKQVAALRENPQCGVAYCKTRQYHLGERPTDCPARATGQRMETLFPWLLTRRCWGTLTPLFRKSVCDEVGPWAPLWQEEDWEYDARVAALGIQLVWCPEFLADIRHHLGVRASNDSSTIPKKMQSRAIAHAAIYRHARRAGIGSDNPHMQRFARELFWLARECGAAGQIGESQQLFELAREASGVERARKLDFRLYRLAATCLGWATAGRAACWLDSWRKPNNDLDVGISGGDACTSA